MTYASEFYATRNNFKQFANYTKPLSYSEWVNLDSAYKAAVLYVQFFEQITLAWNKTRSVYSLESDGVSEVIQYLLKNVKKIEEDAKRFTPNYIYRVAYNCLYCLCRDPNRYKRTFENEISNRQYSDNGDELDLFDTLSKEDTTCEDAISGGMDLKRQFWAIIENEDLDVQKVVALLVGDYTRPVKVADKDGYRVEYKEFKDADLEGVTDADIARVKRLLRAKLVKYYNIMR